MADIILNQMMLGEFIGRNVCAVTRVRNFQRFSQRLSDIDPVPLEANAEASRWPEGYSFFFRAGNPF
jgi:hypothetical protein